MRLKQPEPRNFNLVVWEPWATGSVRLRLSRLPENPNADVSLEPTRPKSTRSEDLARTWSREKRLTEIGCEVQPPREDGDDHDGLDVPAHGSPPGLRGPGKASGRRFMARSGCSDDRGSKNVERNRQAGKNVQYLHRECWRSGGGCENHQEITPSFRPEPSFSWVQGAARRHGGSLTIRWLERRWRRCACEAGRGRRSAR